KKRSCDAESLFLSSGYVGAAPLDPGVIPVWQTLNEFIRAGCFTCELTLFYCSVLISPAQIIMDRTGEEHILLEHDRHLVSQHLHIVFPHIPSPDFYRSLRGVIETADQVAQTGLPRSGASYDTDS